MTAVLSHHFFLMVKVAVITYVCWFFNYFGKVNPLKILFVTCKAIGPKDVFVGVHSVGGEQI